MPGSDPAALELAEGSFGQVVQRQLIDEVGAVVPIPSGSTATLVVAADRGATPIIDAPMTAALDESGTAITDTLQYVIQQGDTDQAGLFEAVIWLDNPAGTNSQGQPVPASRTCYPLPSPELWRIVAETQP